VILVFLRSKDFLSAADEPAGSRKTGPTSRSVFFAQRVVYPILVAIAGLIIGSMGIAHLLSGDTTLVWWVVASAAPILLAAGLVYLLFFRRFWIRKTGAWY
jgi:hypothetical protein